MTANERPDDVLRSVGAFSFALLQVTDLLKEEAWSADVIH